MYTKGNLTHVPQPIRKYAPLTRFPSSVTVMVKRHDIYLIEKTQFLEDINLIVNAGLSQARADHPNARKIWLDLDPSENCYSAFTYWRLWREM